MFFLVVLALVLLSFAFTLGRVLVRTVGQRMKGRLELTVGHGRYRPGQDVAGMLTVTAKKPLGPGRLVASLVCIEEWKEWDRDRDGHNRSRTRRREIYRQDVDVVRDLSVSRGRQHRAPFALRSPQPQDTVAPDPDASGLGRLLHSLSEALAAPPRDTFWKIEGRYHVDGVDLTTAERIPLDYRVR